jgi:hypothetical protein
MFSQRQCATHGQWLVGMLLTSFNHVRIEVHTLKAGDFKKSFSAVPGA